MENDKIKFYGNINQFVDKLTKRDIKWIRDNVADIYLSNYKWYIYDRKMIGVQKKQLLTYLFPECKNDIDKLL